MDRPFDFLKGELLLIDKPLGWTSFDVVNKIRSLLRHREGIHRIKVGHAGTLDPLATGLLIICTGQATKEISNYLTLDKEYTGTMMLGATTPSFDKETEIDRQFDISHIGIEDIHAAALKLTGIISQVPPVYSAMKIRGKRAYQYARKNEPVEMPAREVTIHEFEITKIELPEIEFRVRCSKGTYIRSLAKDFGESMHSGAYLSSLRRTRIGNHLLSDAITLEQLELLLSHQDSLA
jgi:tRNA pseudouridine55 synthase